MARILIAEDDVNIFKLVSFRLSRLGHEVIWAQNGSEALEMARAEMPDLLLLDVMMPVYDGFQVLSLLKGDPATQGILVIMLTARGHAKDVVAGIERGADDYVIKPFSFSELVVRVNALLER